MSALPADTIVRRGRRIHVRHGSPLARIAGLSPRQWEIVRCRCEDDMSNKEIGYKLGLSEQTIKNHITDVLAKLGSIAMYSACTAYGRWRERHEAGTLPDHAVRANDV